MQSHRRPGKLTVMTRRPRITSLLCGLLLSLLAARRTPAQPPPQATAAFDTYTTSLEAQLTRQHSTDATFLAGGPTRRTGEITLQHLPAPTPAGTLLHHWRATAFVPGASAANFERLLRDFDAYPRTFAPEVLTAHANALTPTHLQAALRVRQKHVLTVVLDTQYDVTFGALDPNDRFSTSRSTRIYELDPAGTTPAPDHGFLWRLNTYWTYAERDGGLYLQVETVSLSRAIPTGLGWALRPYVESVPRESLEFTLHSAILALQKPGLTHPS